MKKVLDKNWFTAALIRAIRTMAQTALGMLSVGLAIKDVDWLNMLSVSAVAGVYSLLTSIVTDLPEIDKTEPDGVLNINTSNPDFDNYLLEFDNLDDLQSKDTVKLKVNKQ